MLVNFNEYYITVFDSNFSCRHCKELVTEVHDLEHAKRYTKLRSKTSTSCENAQWTKGISWISASSTKSVESGEISRYWGCRRRTVWT